MQEKKEKKKLEERIKHLQGQLVTGQPPPQSLAAPYRALRHPLCQRLLQGTTTMRCRMRCKMNIIRYRQ